MIVDTVNRSVTPRSRSMGGCGECLGKRGKPAIRKRRNKMTGDEDEEKTWNWDPGRQMKVACGIGRKEGRKEEEKERGGDRRKRKRKREKKRETRYGDGVAQIWWWLLSSPQSPRSHGDLISRADVTSAEAHLG